jgi:hypothetical protein
VGITPVTEGYCIQQALIDNVVGQRKAGSTLSSRLQIAIASRQKVQASDNLCLPQELLDQLQQGLLSRDPPDRAHMMVAEPQSLISSLGDEKRDIRWASRDLDPHPARLIRWVTVRPRCMSSVVQTLVAGTNTYLAWSKPLLQAARCQWPSNQ